MRPLLKVGPLVTAAVILVACGTNNSVIRVSPATADAKNYPGGVVPFSASGASKLTWCIGTMNGVCNGFIASPAVIDSSGTRNVFRATAQRLQCLPEPGRKL